MPAAQTRLEGFVDQLAIADEDGTPNAVQQYLGEVAAATVALLKDLRREYGAVIQFVELVNQGGIHLELDSPQLTMAHELTVAAIDSAVIARIFSRRVMDLVALIGEGHADAAALQDLVARRRQLVDLENEIRDVAQRLGVSMPERAPEAGAAHLQGEGWATVGRTTWAVAADIAYLRDAVLNQLLPLLTRVSIDFNAMQSVDAIRHAFDLAGTVVPHLARAAVRPAETRAHVLNAELNHVRGLATTLADFVHMALGEKDLPVHLQQRDIAPRQLFEGSQSVVGEAARRMGDRLRSVAQLLLDVRNAANASPQLLPNPSPNENAVIVFHSAARVAAEVADTDIGVSLRPSLADMHGQILPESPGLSGEQEELFELPGPPSDPTTTHLTERVRAAARELLVIVGPVVGDIYSLWGLVLGAHDGSIPDTPGRRSRLHRASVLAVDTAVSISHAAEALYQMRLDLEDPDTLSGGDVEFILRLVGAADRLAMVSAIGIDLAELVNSLRRGPDMTYPTFDQPPDVRNSVLASGFGRLVSAPASVGGPLGGALSYAHRLADEITAADAVPIAHIRGRLTDLHALLTSGQQLLPVTDHALTDTIDELDALLQLVDELPDRAARGLLYAALSRLLDYNVDTGEPAVIQPIPGQRADSPPSLAFHPDLAEEYLYWREGDALLRYHRVGSEVSVHVVDDAWFTRSGRGEVRLGVAYAQPPVRGGVLSGQFHLTDGPVNVLTPLNQVGPGEGNDGPEGSHEQDGQRSRPHRSRPSPGLRSKPSPPVRWPTWLTRPGRAMVLPSGAGTRSGPVRHPAAGLLVADLAPAWTRPSAAPERGQRPSTSSCPRDRGERLSNSWRRPARAGSLQAAVIAPAADYAAWRAALTQLLQTAVAEVRQAQLRVLRAETRRRSTAAGLDITPTWQQAQTVYDLAARLGAAVSLLPGYRGAVDRANRNVIEAERLAGELYQAMAELARIKAAMTGQAHSLGLSLEDGQNLPAGDVVFPEPEGPTQANPLHLWRVSPPR